MLQVELCAQKRCAGVLASVSVTGALLGNRIFVGVILDLGGPYNDRCPYKKRRHIDTQRRRQKMEAECSDAAMNQGMLGAPRS